MTDLDAQLHAQEAALDRDQEISRVLHCHSKDYFAIMQINPLSASSSFGTLLRKIYRKKTLQIHPDKVKNKDAPIAFDMLKRANLVLAADALDKSDTSGENMRRDSDGSEDLAKLREKENLESIYHQVSEGIGADVVDNFNHESNRRIREKVHMVLDQHDRDKEVEREFLQRQELRRQSEIKTAAKDRELKKSWESRWENDRDSRVKSWRSFSSKVEKPKKKKKTLV